MCRDLSRADGLLLLQVSQALAQLQAEHKQRFAVPGNAADQPTADAASEGEAPSIGLQRPVQQMPRKPLTSHLLYACLVSQCCDD